MTTLFSLSRLYLCNDIRRLKQLRSLMLSTPFTPKNSYLKKTQEAFINKLVSCLFSCWISGENRIAVHKGSGHTSPLFNKTRYPFYGLSVGNTFEKTRTLSKWHLLQHWCSHTWRTREFIKICQLHLLFTYDSFDNQMSHSLVNDFGWQFN